jgi:hypothetical protein
MVCAAVRSLLSPRMDSLVIAALWLLPLALLPL